MQQWSVIVATRSRAEALAETLRRLPAPGGCVGEVIVVDNASSDGSVQMVRQEFPGVTLHANPDNRGYGAAANQAVAASTSRYVLVLNADTLLTPGAPTGLASRAGL